MDEWRQIVKNTAKCMPKYIQFRATGEITERVMKRAEEIGLFSIDGSDGSDENGGGEKRISSESLGFGTIQHFETTMKMVASLMKPQVYRILRA